MVMGQRLDLENQQMPTADPMMTEIVRHWLIFKLCCY